MLCSRPGKPERDILRESGKQNSLLATVITESVSRSKRRRDGIQRKAVTAAQSDKLNRGPMARREFNRILVKILLRQAVSNEL